MQPEASPGSGRPTAESWQSLARRLKRLLRSHALDTLAGSYHSARRGAGLEFSELRAYEPGDDVRAIDWKVTARQNRPYVRRYVEERALSLWIVIDGSASMLAGRDGQTPADRARQIALLLSVAALRNKDRVGLCIVAERARTLTRPTWVLARWARAWERLNDASFQARTAELDQVAPVLGHARRRALVVLLGDFRETMPSQPWTALARRHHVIAIQLGDALELDPPRVGLVAIEDPETGRRGLLDLSSQRQREQLVRTNQARWHAFETWHRACGIHGLSLTTDVDPLMPIVQLFQNMSARRARVRQRR